MHLASLIVLIILPGAWLAFAPGSNHLSYSARFALAVALSPLVTAVQFYGFRLAGLTFQQAVPALQLLNLGSVLLIGRAFAIKRPRMSWRQGLLGGAVFASVASCVAIPWLWEPGFRRYSWHGLVHTDIVYAFARGALLPEEPELAGVPLAYPWMGHLYWSLLAWSADLSPTIIYLISNLALLAATGVLGYWLTRELGGSEPTSLAVPVILALGTSIPGLIGWSVIPPNGDSLWWAILGDLRYAPFLLKFVTFEIMTFGLALYAALVFLCVIALRYYGRFELFLTPVVVAAIGALYPNLLPAAALLLAGLIAVLFWGHRYLEGRYTTRTFLGLVISAGLAVAVGVLFVQLYTMSRSTGDLSISSFAALVKKSIAASLALVPFVLAAYWMWRSEPNHRRGPLLTLGFAACGAVALNLLLRTSGLNEYKFFVAAGFCLAAPAAIGLERVVLNTQRSRWGLLAALPVLLALVMVSYSAKRIPHHGSPPMDAKEGSFWLALTRDNPETQWTHAVRTQTPLDAFLIVKDPMFHAPAFTGRPLFVPFDGDRVHFGYNMESRFNLLELRGYNPQLFNERRYLISRVYDPDSGSDDRAETLRRLRLLGRPIAIVFGPNEGQTFVRWLRSRKIGLDVFAGHGGRSVYLIPSL